MGAVIDQIAYIEGRKDELGRVWDGYYRWV